MNSLLIRRIFKKGRTRAGIYLIFFAFLVLPIAAIGFIGIRNIAGISADEAISRRGSVAYLASTTLSAKFDLMTNLAVSFAARPGVREYAAAGEWVKAIEVLQDVPGNFLFVDRVFIADTSGVLTADVPELPGIRGVNFAHRDWYQGVSRNWQPYISEIYKRSAVPQFNVVAVAVPVYGDGHGVIGILVLQVRLDNFFEWSKEIEVGRGGFAYFVDAKGNVAGHHKYPSQGEIVNFSDDPIVRKTLDGERGVDVIVDQITGEKFLVAFEPLVRYGWGVVVVESDASAFASTRSNTGSFAAILGVALIVSSLFVVVALKTLAAIEQFRQKERILIESIGDGIVAIDRHWTIIEWNKAAAAITGWQKDEVVGRPLRSVLQFVRQHDRRENLAFIEHALVTGEIGFMENSTILKRKDGVDVPVSDSASPIFDESGRVTGAIVIFRDVTREREAQSLRSDFAYAAHQLRNPVTKIAWAFETALESEDIGALKTVLRSGQLASKSLAKIMNELVDVTLVDQMKVIPTMAAAKLAPMLKKAAAAVEAKAKMQRVAVKIGKTPKDAAVKTDAVLLAKTLEEILDNAVTYSYAGGMVRIDVEPRDRHLVIRIADAGIGIPEREQPLVFHKFFRGGNFDTTAIVGAGLGLYLSNEYVKLLKGKIWFTSDEKSGSVFFISVPEARASNRKAG